MPQLCGMNIQSSQSRENPQIWLNAPAHLAVYDYGSVENDFMPSVTIASAEIS